MVPAPIGQRQRLLVWDWSVGIAAGTETMKRIVLGALLLAACDPKAAVNVVQSGVGYTVEFENCSRPAQVLPLKSLSIRIAGTDKDVSPWCTLTQGGTSSPAIVGSWKYGDATPGYVMEGCAPLRNDTTYEVQAQIAVALAHSVIRIGGNGELQRTKGGCK